MSKKKRRRMFTLTELLVVIAALAVQVSMLMPVLVRSRAAALRAACVNNVRQMGLTLHMYSTRNDGRMPAGATPGDIYQALDDEGFLENRQILSCPGNPVDEVHFGSSGGVSYLIDHTMGPERHPRRAVYADRGLENHARGYNVLFEDGHVLFLTSEGGGPGNPYLPSVDTNIFAGTEETEGHAEVAWIRWPGEMVGLGEPGWAFFESDGVFDVPGGITRVHVLLVGGGGSGGSSGTAGGGGGGGAGGVVFGTQSVSLGEVIRVTVGAGGAGSGGRQGASGEDSTFGALTALGGGGGGLGDYNSSAGGPGFRAGKAGGSGGGGGGTQGYGIPGGTGGTGLQGSDGGSYAGGFSASGGGGFVGAGAGNAGGYTGGDGGAGTTLENGDIAGLDVLHLRALGFDAGLLSREFAGGGGGGGWSVFGLGSHGGGDGRTGHGAGPRGLRGAGQPADPGAWGSGGGGSGGGSAGGRGADGMVLIYWY